MTLTSLKELTLTEQATSMLHDYIINEQSIGQFLPSEMELCKKMCISRSTLRESIKVIESKGLVKRIQGKGIQVVNESQRATSEMISLMIKREDARIDHLLEMRNIVEVRSAALAAVRASVSDLKNIELPLKKMISKETSKEEYVRADIDFHVEIAKATHNKILVLMLEVIRPFLSNAIDQTIQLEAFPEHRHHFHERIYKAIKNHDPEASTGAMAEHFNGLQSIIEELDIK
jgi:GntR family transcriptional repressor for pyruvate dehydrogenase complex